MDATATVCLRLSEWLLSASIKGSALIALILLCRWLFWKRISPKLRACLWLLLFIQLACPYAPFSVANIAPKPLTASMAMANATLFQQPENFVAPSKPNMNANAPGFVERTGTLRLSLLGAWLLVAAALASCIFARNIRKSMHLRSWPQVVDSRFLTILESCKESAGVRFPVGLLSSEECHSPLLCGWLRPSIVMPAQMLESFSDDELRLVLLHELAHIKRNDVALNWLSAIFQTVHWFNPLVWLAFRILRADREQACDALAIRNAGAERKALYGETLIKTMKLINNVPLSPALPELVGIAEDKDQMKMRLAQIGLFGKTAKFSALASLGVVAALSTFVATGYADNQKGAVCQASAGKGAGAQIDKTPNCTFPEETTNPEAEAQTHQFRMVKLAPLDFKDTPIETVAKFLEEKSGETIKGAKVEIAPELAGRKISVKTGKCVLNDVMNAITEQNEDIGICWGAGQVLLVNIATASAEGENNQKTLRLIKETTVTHIELKDTSIEETAKLLMAEARKDGKDIKITVAPSAADVKRTMTSNYQALNVVLYSVCGGYGSELTWAVKNGEVVIFRSRTAKADKTPYSEESGRITDPKERRAHVEKVQKLRGAKFAPLDFKDTPIETVVKALAEKSGGTVKIAPGLAGRRITVKTGECVFNDVMNAISQANADIGICWGEGDGSEVLLISMEPASIAEGEENQKVLKLVKETTVSHIELKDTTLEEAAKLLMAEARKNGKDIEIVVSPAVTGVKRTMTSNYQSLNTVLTFLCKYGPGLAWIVDDGKVVICQEAGVISREAKESAQKAK